MLVVASLYFFVENQRQARESVSERVCEWFDTNVLLNSGAYQRTSRPYAADCDYGRVTLRGIFRFALCTGTVIVVGIIRMTIQFVRIDRASKRTDSVTYNSTGW